MHHSFNVSFATEYGVPEAILLNFLEYWVMKNESIGKHFHDGRYWTYNTVNAMTIQFPYLTNYQIRNALKHLETEGLILIGNFNETPYDRTLWYTLSDYGKRLLSIENIEFAKTKNGNLDFDTPIPVREPIIYTKENTLKGVKEKTNKVRFSPPTYTEVTNYCNENGLEVDAERFINFYESKGWMVGKNKMKSWKAAVRNWASRDKQDKKPTTDPGREAMQERIRRITARYSNDE